MTHRQPFLRPGPVDPLAISSGVCMPSNRKHRHRQRPLRRQTQRRTRPSFHYCIPANPPPTTATGITTATNEGSARSRHGPGGKKTSLSLFYVTPHPRPRLRKLNLWTLGSRLIIGYNSRPITPTASPRIYRKSSLTRACFSFLRPSTRDSVASFLQVEGTASPEPVALYYRWLNRTHHRYPPPGPALPTKLAAPSGVLAHSVNRVRLIPAIHYARRRISTQRRECGNSAPQGIWRFRGMDKEARGLAT